MRIRPRLNKNLVEALNMARISATSFESPTLELPRQWQAQIMDDLTPVGVADKSWYGKFRGEMGQEYIGVKIASYEGTPPQQVEEELAKFIKRTQRIISEYDEKMLTTDEHGNRVVVQDLDDSVIRAIIGLMALVHGEWTRIHPFANGNGRTARLWANWIAMRYGLTPFVTLRPRPGKQYEMASSLAMQGQWQEMRPVFEEMFNDLASEKEVRVLRKGWVEKLKMFLFES